MGGLAGEHVTTSYEAFIHYHPGLSAKWLAAAQRFNMPAGEILMMVYISQ
jgi:hypothetical protein